MKFEREIPIGLDARRKKWQGGAIKAPPPMGLGLSFAKDTDACASDYNGLVYTHYCVCSMGNPSTC